MAFLMQNVDIDQSLCDFRLCTTGICSCIAMIVLLNNDKTFIYHISPLDFNVTAKGIAEEVQMLIQKAIFQYTEYNRYHSSLMVYTMENINDSIQNY